MAGEISFRPTIDDYVAGNRAWFWRAMGKRRFFWTVAIGELCVVLIGLAITRGEMDQRLKWTVIGAMAAGFLAWMAIMTGLSYAFQPLAARRLFRQHRALDREFAFAWDEAGTRFVAENGNSTTACHDYHGWYDGRSVLLLMLNDRLFHFIPHRVLSDEQLVDLRRLAPRAGEERPG